MVIETIPVIRIKTTSNIAHLGTFEVIISMPVGLTNNSVYD